MKPKIFMRSYCIIGLGDKKGIKEDLKFIAETEINFVSGEELLIATFMSTLRIREIEEFFKMNERSFIVFEMTPGFFGAHLGDNKFQEALFGSMGMSNKGMGINEIENNLIEFMKTIKEDLEEIDLPTFINKKECDPTLDEILDRINQIGVENLTNKEKQLLHKYSN